MTCGQKRQLLSDYLERTQALAVEVELTLQTIEGNSPEEESGAWVRLEQARIHCDIAHLALLNHLTSHSCDGSASAH
jgi:hypothetical protein